MSTEHFARFIHCRRCVETNRTNQSPAEYSKLDLGITTDGEIEVWCRRHNISVSVLTENGALKPEIKNAPCAVCGVSGPHKH